MLENSQKWNHDDCRNLADSLHVFLASAENCDAQETSQRENLKWEVRELIKVVEIKTDEWEESDRN